MYLRMVAFNTDIGFMFCGFWFYILINICGKVNFNPFPNTPFWYRPKFKEAADDIWNVAILGF